MDFTTTRIGLQLGFHEAHIHYNPLIALTVYWVILTVLNTTIVERKLLTFSALSVCLVSFIAPLNNILVILGIFPGLIS